MTTTTTARTADLYPWCVLADIEYRAGHESNAEHFMRVGLIDLQITEADIPADVRDELRELVPTHPRMARVALAAWVRAVISCEVDPSKPGFDAEDVA